MSTKCPICGKIKNNKQSLIDHVDTDHSDVIPNNMTTCQYIYSLNHDGRSYGLCRVCGGATPWNEKTGKPKQICDNPLCRKTQAKKAKENMIRVYGKASLLNDPKVQESMLSHRKISGIYTWSDKIHQFVYTGSYEKFALEWLDKVVEFDPCDIQMPGPSVKYLYNNKEHIWITDMYIPSLNLIIEYKDGGDDKNTHPGFSHNRDLEKAKDDYMKKQNKFNYIKITNKNMLQLIYIINEIKLKNVISTNPNNEYRPVTIINEASSPMSEVCRMTNAELDKLSDLILEESSPLGQAPNMNAEVFTFGNGEYSAAVSINNKNLKNSPYQTFETKTEDTYDSIFSPRQEKNAINFIRADDNLQEIDRPLNEDDAIAPVYVDMDADSTQSSLPISTGSLTRTIYTSNFN